MCVGPVKCVEIFVSGLHGVYLYHQLKTVFRGDLNIVLSFNRLTVRFLCERHKVYFILILVRWAMKTVHKIHQCSHLPWSLLLLVYLSLLEAE